MERYFCVGIAPLVALMAADREAPDQACRAAPEPQRQHPPPPHAVPAERGMEVLSAAHS